MMLFFGKAVLKHSVALGLKTYLPEVLVCGNDIYKHFGCNGQELMLSDQPWQLRPETSAMEASLVKSVPINHGIHLMCRWFEEFHELGAFPYSQLQSVMWPPVHTVITIVEAASKLDFSGRSPRVIPVEGIGRILAVSQLLNDFDCLGGDGANVGYTTTVTNPDTNAPLYAKAIKIDPGKSFTNFSASSGSAAVQRDIALGIVRVAPGITLPVDSLPLDVKHEFLSTVASIRDTSDATLESLLVRPGMEPLFPTPSTAAHYADSMASIRDALATRYSDAIAGIPLPPTTADDCLSAIKLNYFEQVKVVDPVTGSYSSVLDVFVDPRLLLRLETTPRGSVCGQSLTGDDATLPIHDAVVHTGTHVIAGHRTHRRS